MRHVLICEDKKCSTEVTARVDDKGVVEEWVCPKCGGNQKELADADEANKDKEKQRKKKKVKAKAEAKEKKEKKEKQAKKAKKPASDEEEAVNGDKKE